MCWGWGGVCPPIPLNKDTGAHQPLYTGSLLRGRVLSSSSYDYYYDPIHLTNVDCTGEEDNLLDCSYDLGEYACSHYDNAVVMCIPADPTSPSKDLYYCRLIRSLP